MAVPKRKTTKSKRNMRRAHDALAGTQVQECPNCGEMKRSHHICSSCGHYGDREVLETSEIL